MKMSAIVLSSDVSEMVFYDQVTGVGKPGYSVKMTVLDAETDEKYECQFNDGFRELDELKQYRLQGAPREAFEDAVQRLRGNLPPKLTQVMIEVRKIKVKKGFMSMTCRLLGVGAVAAAA
jgi:hypothetical protein